MKKILLTLSLSLILSACASSAGLSKEIAQKDPELKEIAKLWASVQKDLKAEDCEGFKAHLRDSMQKTECELIFSSIKQKGVPEINWEKVQWNSKKTAIKLWEKDSVASLTTLRQVTKDGKSLWQIERRFW